MTPEAESALLEKIERLEAVITHSTKEDEPSWLKEKLSEQGSQRGLIIIITVLLVKFFNADETMVTQLLEGAALIYGSHDIVTPG